MFLLFGGILLDTGRNRKGGFLMAKKQKRAATDSKQDMKQSSDCKDCKQEQQESKSENRK